MEIIEHIHQKLEKMELTPFELQEVKYLVDLARRDGAVHKESIDPLEGYSNLTAAISAKEPIEWEELDGRKVQCVNPELGELRGTLARDHFWPANSGSGWEVCGMGAAYATVTAWRGKDGWTLWLEGEIPLRRKTADQLEAYTYFYGEGPSGEPDLMYIGGLSESSKIIYYAPEMHKTDIPATGWVVIEEYGPFQKPEENKK